MIGPKGTILIFAHGQGLSSKYDTYIVEYSTVEAGA